MESLYVMGGRLPNGVYGDDMTLGTIYNTIFPLHWYALTAMSADILVIVFMAFIALLLSIFLSTVLIPFLKVPSNIFSIDFTWIAI